MTCPDEDTLARYVNGVLAPEATRDVRTHVTGCSECRGVLAALSALEAPVSGPLVTGTRVGRYVVLGLLGEGGMGRVHAAYDPELDRKVALKLLNLERLREGTLTEARQRLEREARTMARLSHPHVASLHDVGEYQGQLFLVMELVEGGTLRRWLLEKPRSRREVLARFIQAAEGLAATHALGIVHRDFKPDNVLLTKDGQVRITDFGLSNVTGVSSARLEAGAAVAGTERLTVTGALLGTPAYGSPEQLRGERGDARSDQFAFCVALYEALNGQRPFEGSTHEELLSAMERQAIRPEQPGVPGWLKALVRRGLSADPSRRFESMEALRARLARDAGAWRRTLVTAVVGGGLVGAAFLAWGHASAPPRETCHGSERHLVGVWDAPLRESTRQAFLKTGAPAAEASFQAVASALDRWTQDWTRAHQAACEATRVFGEQSEAALGLRMTCLDQRLGELGRLTVALQGADTRTVERGFALGTSLGGVSRCADVRTLQEAVSPPEDTVARAEVEAVRAALAKAGAELLAGHASEALKVALPARERALLTRHRPLEAEAHLLCGRLQEEAGAFEDARGSLSRGALAAEAGRHLGVLARLLHAQAWLMGHDLRRVEEAWPFLHRARAVAETLRDAELDTLLDHVQAELLEQEGRFAEAEPLLRKSLDAATARGQVLARAELNGRLGILARHQGRLLDAKRWQEEALQLHEALHGAEHPHTGVALLNLGGTLAHLGELTRAEASLQRALAIHRWSLGEDHLAVARTLSNLAIIYFEWGHGAQAREAAETSLSVARKSVGPESPLLMGMESNRLGVLGELGAREEELAQARRSLLHHQRVYGAHHPEVALDAHEVGRLLRLLGRAREARGFHAQGVSLQEPLLSKGQVEGEGLRSLADALLFLGRVDEARTHAQSALAKLERDQGPSSPERIKTLLLLGDIHLARGSPAEALAPLRTGLDALAAQQVVSAQVPLMRRRLAQALRLTGAGAEACQEAARAWSELEPWRRAYAQETSDARAELGHCPR
ncbi:serine/threonine-protein kinase [Myxococcus landrumensis]|uniref:Tetratricopeptide repeat protein n=1 Tax=Myxococcus landrumensis TaxID=2813577 RepID=A0ABX7N5V3_9BACT|nr:serine/threonine-protein kinase [Myxococcus landrumus]QSQ13828.1 tetratricopeptide repeat protein [Myxococcus landrumus]